MFRTETNSADSGVRRRGQVTASGAAIAVVLTVALAGCSTGEADAESASQAVGGSPAASASTEPSASPSPEQTEPDGPEAIIEQRTADAIERYKEYVQIKDAFEQRGESAYEELNASGLLGSHEAREYEKEWGSSLEESGRKQTGGVVVGSIKSVKYDGDPLKDFNGHEVKFRTCLDSSAVDYVDSNGKKVPGKRPDQITTDVTMRGTLLSVNGERKPVWSLSMEYVVEEEC